MDVHLQVPAGLALETDVAFRSWYQQTLPRLYSYLLSRCGDVAVAEELVQQLATVPGLANLQVDRVLGSPNLIVQLDRDEILRSGLDPEALAQELRYRIGEIFAKLTERTRTQSIRHAGHVLEGECDLVYRCLVHGAPPHATAGISRLRILHTPHTIDFYVNVNVNSHRFCC